MGTANILKKLADNLDSTVNLAERGLYWGAIIYASKGLQNCNERHAANHISIMGATAGWLNGLAQTAIAWNGLDNFITERGNVARSWRTWVARGLFASAVSVGGVAIKQSTYDGNEMMTAGLALASGALMTLSGFFSNRETLAAYRGELPPKVRSGAGFFPQVLNNAGNANLLPQAQSAPGEQPGVEASYRPV